MYLEHFGLREAPFRVTPHTEYFFSGGNRGATLEALIYAITHDEGIVKVSGEVGSGKTMLCRALLERLPERVATVYLANPSLSREEILFVIADGLGLQLPDGRTHQQIRSLQKQLTRIRTEGKQVIVIIDEAHAMPGEALEEICRLSNLELDHRKLLQFVLVGQPDLDFRLRQPDMRQLRERVTHNFALEPLTGSDVAGYLSFRMRAAGYHGPDPFTPAAVQIVARASEGLTRRINILADKALLAAATHGSRQIDARLVQTVADDAQFGPLPGKRVRPGLWLGLGGGLASVLAVIYLATQALPPAGAEPAAEASPPVATAPAPPSDPSPQPPFAISEPPVAQAVAPAATTADTPAPAGEPTNGAEPNDLGPLTRERLAASEGWLKNAPGSHYFIQLLNTDIRNAGAVETFLATHGKTLDPQQLRAYRSDLSGRDRIGIIYGDYPTQGQATAALSTLPPAVADARPFIRSVDKLR